MNHMLEAFYSPSVAPQILTSAAFYLVWRLINVQLFICSSQEIESLLVNWSGPDLTGFGELVLEGSFKVHRVKKERAFFLFDKMLLIAKKRLEQFVYSTHIFVRASIFHDCLFSLMYYHPSCFTSKQPWSRNGIPASSPGFQLWVLSVFLCSLVVAVLQSAAGGDPEGPSVFQGVRSDHPEAAAHCSGECCRSCVSISTSIAPKLNNGHQTW